MFITSKGAQNVHKQGVSDVPKLKIALCTAVWGTTEVRWQDWLDVRVSAPYVKCTNPGTLDVQDKHLIHPATVKLSLFFFLWKTFKNHTFSMYTEKYETTCRPLV